MIELITPDHRPRQFSSLFFILWLTAIAGLAQSTEKPVLSISGEVLRPLSLTIDDLSRLPQTMIKVKDRENREHEYHGVAMVEVLKAAGVTLGGQLRGGNLVKYVLFTAADRYQAVYALTELDPEFTSNVVLVATSVDDRPLPEGEGPFRLVNPEDKKPARWVRQLKSIDVQLAANKQ